MDATAVIVNFESGSRLSQLLNALADLVETVVVDNASRDGSADLADRPRVRLIRNGVNRGFARAANQGAAGLRTSWILFLNPDVHPSKADLAALLNNVPSDVDVVAPLQTDAGGRPRPESGGFDPSCARFLAWALLPGRLRGNLGPWLGPPYPSADRELAWVSGACMAVRREAFERVGGFDERFFLYLEDVDLCLRIRQAGGKVLCRGGIRVFHEVAGGDPGRRGRAIPTFVRSLGILFPGFRRRLIGAALVVGFSIRRLGGDRTAGAGLKAALHLLTRADTPE